MCNPKKWGISLLCLLLTALFLCCALTVIIDPYFHYHAPLPFLQYPISNERYQNDGIAKHFSYDAIITGTSMSENFKTSECDALFGVNAIKTCFNGSSLKEATDHLWRAIDANPQIRLVIRGFDGWNLLEPADLMKGQEKIPFYLYDANPFNDVEYVLNKTILLQDTIGVLKHTLKGNPTTSFDEYGRWHQYATFGANVVKAGYQRPQGDGSQVPWTEAESAILSESLAKNAIDMALQHPEIEFYYFFTPYSIVTMDHDYRNGLLLQQFAAYKQATREMLDVENIRVFSFFDDYDSIADLDNYYDAAHYHEDINSQILIKMAAGEHLLTKETYEQYWDTVSQYYLSYPYNSLF